MFLPMVIAVILHLRPNRTEAEQSTCGCALGRPWRPAGRDGRDGNDVDAPTAGSLPLVRIPAGVRGVRDGRARRGHRPAGRAGRRCDTGGRLDGGRPAGRGGRHLRRRRAGPGVPPVRHTRRRGRSVAAGAAKLEERRLVLPVSVATAGSTWPGTTCC
ncbi:hypothetical protein NKG94_27175 [Micromonospora sp. M12]